MEGLRHPVGRQPATVYWRRRLMVLLGVILLAVVTWFLIVAPGGDGAEDPGASVTTSPQVTASQGAQDASRACGVDDVTITVTPNPQSVPVGSMPVFDVSIAHQSSSPCLLSIGGEDSTLVITSGDTQIYATTDCPAESPITARDLLLSEGSTDSFQVTWNGSWSAPECGTATHSTDPGYYWATLTLQGIPAESVQFQLTA